MIYNQRSPSNLASAISSVIEFEAVRGCAIRVFFFAIDTVWLPSGPPNHIYAPPFLSFLPLENECAVLSLRLAFWNVDSTGFEKGGKVDRKLAFSGGCSALSAVFSICFLLYGGVLLMRFPHDGHC